MYIGKSTYVSMRNTDLFLWFFLNKHCPHKRLWLSQSPIFYTFFLHLPICFVLLDLYELTLGGKINMFLAYI